MSANEKMTISIAYLKYWCWWLLTKGGLGDRKSTRLNSSHRQ